MKLTVGMRVRRKWDDATGAIVKRSEVFQGGGLLRPFKALWSVRLDDQALRVKAGGDMVGDTGWLRSNFKEVR